MKREKIGSSYFRTGYGRHAPRKANVYFINGKAYAKDKATAETSNSYNPIAPELEGYVRVNGYGKDGFFVQVSDTTERDRHEPYKKN